MEPPPTPVMASRQAQEETPERQRLGPSLNGSEDCLRDAVGSAVSAGMRDGTERPGHAQEAEKAVHEAEAELEEEHAPAAAGQHAGGGGDSTLASAGSAEGSGAVAGLRGPATLLCCCCARVALAFIPAAVKVQAAERMGGGMSNIRMIVGKHMGLSGMRKSTRRSLQPSLATRMHAAWRTALERLAVFSLISINVTGRATRTFSRASQALRANLQDGGGTGELSVMGRRRSVEPGILSADASPTAGGSVAAGRHRNRSNLEGDVGRTTTSADAFDSGSRSAAGVGRHAATKVLPGAVPPSLATADPETGPLSTPGTSSAEQVLRRPRGSGAGAVA